MRLIDANKLKEVFTLPEEYMDEKDESFYHVSLPIIRATIDDAPTVEPKHGHWIFGTTMGHSWMKCSECCVAQSGQTATFTYCPSCGADMDGEVEYEDQ